jgi:hypothetical protein
MSRVVVAGARAHPSCTSLPSLTALLMMLDVSDMTLWDSENEARFPLERIARDADVVIDVRLDEGARVQSGQLAMDRPEGSVIRPDPLDGRSLIAPGLIRVALACPPGSMQIDLDMLRLGALGVAQAARAGATWPRSGDGCRTVDLVAAAAWQAIDPRLSS